MPYRKYVLGGLAALALAVFVGAGVTGFYRADLTATRAAGEMRYEEPCAQLAAHRHLGIAGGYVAVYEGPLGQDERVLQVEEIAVQDLTAAWRQKLEQAADFAAQDSATRALLRQELEFESGEALHAALENLDELKD